MGISTGSWDGSPSRFTDAQYEASCVLDRKYCGSKAPPKTRCSLPIKEPNGDINKNAVHQAAARINQVTGACPQAVSKAKAALRGAYSQLKETPPDSIKDSGSSSGSGSDSGKRDVEQLAGVDRDRALADLSHDWEFTRDKSDDGFLGTLEGHFAVFNRWTEINSPLEGHFMESLAPGAFTKTFSENKGNMRCLFNHGKDPAVGMQALGVIDHLEEDAKGAYYRVKLVDTSYVRDLLPGLRHRLYGASFRFKILREDFQQFPERGQDHNPEGLPESRIREAKVREFGPVTFGQYEDATSSLRSINDELMGLDLGLMAKSDPHAIASFARVLGNTVPLLGRENGRGANVGTEGERTDEGADGTGRTDANTDAERNDPTPEDFGITYALRDIKQAIADAKARQLADRDYGEDDDDAAVMAALQEADDAIDKAIIAQAKDARLDPADPEDDDEDAELSSSVIMGGRDNNEGSTDEGERSTESSSPDQGEESAPVEGAPDRTHRPRGSTLRRRAAPLRTTRTEEDPKWKL